MPDYSVGSLIKRMRKQKGLTQQALADSIMDVSALSRIENEKVMPTKQNLEALFERLKYNPNNVANYFLDGKALKFKEITDELDRLQINGQMNEANHLINRLEHDPDYMEDNLNRQYIMCAKATNMIILQEAHEKIISILKDSIKINIPTFKIKNIKDYLLTTQDLLILNMMATVYADNNKLDETVAILRSLKTNFDEHCIDKTEMGRHYPAIIYHLTKYLGMTGNYTEAVELCDAGCRVCRNTGFHHFLPFITYNKAYCHFRLGDFSSCEILLRRAYYSFGLLEMFVEQEIAENYAKENLGIILTE